MWLTYTFCNFVATEQTQRYNNYSIKHGYVYTSPVSMRCRINEHSFGACSQFDHANIDHAVDVSGERYRTIMVLLFVNENVFCSVEILSKEGRPVVRRMPL